MDNDIKRIGIMGGTFDPIHYGHLAAAEAVLRQFGLGRVIFIPSGRPPHKDCGRVTESEQRYNMTLLATNGNPYFSISRLEIDRGGASYTADTLTDLHKIYGKKTKFYFIVGADAMSEIQSWRSPEKIFDQASLAVVTRPGYDMESLRRNVESTRSKYGAKVHIVDIPGLTISSTELRRRIEIGRPIKYLTPEPVEEYIRHHRLYQNDLVDVPAAERRVSLMLSDKRWRHTAGVEQAAIELAEQYGASRRKAFLAALFHDCSKELPADEKLRLCETWGIKLDEILRKNIELTHPYLSAEIARRFYNVDDPQILSAIRAHTFGIIPDSNEISLMDKILYVADCIEPGRKDIPNLSDIREAAFIDLDRAAAMCIQMEIDYTISKGQAVHPLSRKALDVLSRKSNKKKG